MAISNINWGSIKKREAAQTLVDILQQDPVINGQLIFGWPMGPGIEGQKGAFTCDAVLISDTGQVTVIDLAQDSDPDFPGNYRERQDHGYNIVHSALATNKELVNRRDLKVNVQTITLAPGVPQQDAGNPETPLIDTSNLVEKLREFQSRQSPDVDASQVYNSIIDS